MTENTETTENIVAERCHAVATAIRATEVWDVCEEDDGAGPYIALLNPADIEDERCLSLYANDDDDEEDLSKHLWHFWNHAANTYIDSTLGADAEVEAVLAFLSESLDEEARELAAKQAKS